MNHYQHPTTKQVRAVEPFEFARPTTSKDIDGKETILPAVKSASEIAYDQLIADGFSKTPMTAKEFEAFRNPPKTPEQLLGELSNAVQKHLDSTAQGYRYDGILSAVSYVGDGTDFGKQGAAFKAWRSAVWLAAGDIEAQVKAGKRGVPAADDLIAELPTFKA
jgi:hypothetical protein